jgi:hypothetical protein
MTKPEPPAEFRSKPNKYIAQVKHVTPSTAAKWVARCREMELLRPLRQGERKDNGMPRAKASDARL